MPYKRIIFCIIFFVFLFNITGYTCYADTNVQKVKKVEQKRLFIRKKINELTKLERRTTNTLSKNQQKLEKNKAKLEKTQLQYNRKQANISYLEKELNSSLKQYNRRQSESANRIRCIYKTKHTMIIDLLLSTNSISQFLDRIYYQNLIIQSDRKRMAELKQEAVKIAATKRQLENEKKQLSGLMRVMDRENAGIQKTINQNKYMIENRRKRPC